MLLSFPRRFENQIKDPRQLDALEEEYQLYESMSHDEISKDVWDESLIKVSEERAYHRIDIIWSHLKTTFPKLANIALFLLTLPHSNVKLQGFTA